MANLRHKDSVNASGTNHAAGRYEKLRAWTAGLCGLFCAGSFILFFASKDYPRALLAAVTLLLVCTPGLIERFASCRISTPLYLFAIAYALGSLLGDGYKLYHLTSWWDKLMHTSAGVLFAIIGAVLPTFLNKGRQCSIAVRAVFAVCFSLAISAVWEFFEFGMDRLFGMDMQRDTLITTLNSYFLGDGFATIGSIKNIESVAINGQPILGYSDIGLIDTMLDMLLETLGACLYTLVFIFDKDAHPICVFRHGPGNKELPQK